MTVTAEVICDSISPAGVRFTTLKVRFPRFILPEFNTHRALSRNASSSRAIPVKRSIQMIRDDMAMPSVWNANKPGMQGGDELDEATKQAAIAEWELLGYKAIETAERMNAMTPPAAKQVINRLLEPWSHVSVVVSATDWNNFFHLRDHPDADPTFQELASKMRKEMAASTPTFLNVGSWHLPYVQDEDYDRAIDAVLNGYVPDLIDVGTRERAQMEMASILLRKMSVARCARVSYLNHDGTRPSFDDDMRLFNNLMLSAPLHASPAEHQATPDKLNSDGSWQQPHLHGNLRGYCQYRKFFSNEAVQG